MSGPASVPVNNRPRNSSLRDQQSPLIAVVKIELIEVPKGGYAWRRSQICKAGGVTPRVVERWMEGWILGAIDRGLVRVRAQARGMASRLRSARIRMRENLSFPKIISARSNDAALTKSAR